VTERKRLLQANPDPIKIVPEGTGLREAFKPYRPPRRCWHEDGRGQCTSTDTRSLWNAAERQSEAYCQRHWPEG
jgi:hypothetical protein